MTNEHLSLDLSKRLKELGVVVESAMMYENIGDGEYTVPIPFVKLKKGYSIPAPTFTELLVIFPHFIEIPLENGGTTPQHFALMKESNGGGGYQARYGSSWSAMFRHELSVEAAGMLLVWLKENDYVEERP